MNSILKFKIDGEGDKQKHFYIEVGIFWHPRLRLYLSQRCIEEIELAKWFYNAFYGFKQA